MSSFGKFLPARSTRLCFFPFIVADLAVRRFAVLIALCVCIFGMLTLPILAQSNNSVVEGTVEDKTHYVVTGSEVTLVNRDTGARSVTTTNEAGAYVFPSVAPGTYTLQVSKKGFKSHSISDLRVAVSQRVTKDVVLEVGSTSESVTVEVDGSVALLEPTSNELGTLIDQVSVQQLPLNGRDFLQLGLLSGAAQDAGPTSSDFASLQVGHPDRTIIINGNEQDLTGYTINGMSTAGTRLGQSSLNMSVAAIDQFKIHQGFFLPAEGPTSAGTVSVVTKSGSNRFHGEAFEFIRNSALDARGYFDRGAKPSAFHRNQFGGAISGPIRQNKMFFFAHYEGRRQMRADNVTVTAPTAAMFTGDFSALLNLAKPIQLYDPATYDPVTGKRQPFAGNIIPQNRINAMSKALLAYYVPASTYGPLNLSGNPMTTDNYDQYGGRVDMVLNQKHSLFLQYVHENSPTVNGTLFPNGGYSYPLTTDMSMAQVVSNLTPHVVNQFGFGWIRPSVFYSGDSVSGFQSQLGFTGTADPNGVPGIFLDGFSSSPNPQNPSFGRNQGLIGNIDNQYQMHESLSVLRGNHELKFGGDLRYIRTVQESSNFYSRGGVWFFPTYTAQLAPDSTGKLAAVTGTGSSFADFLLGMPQKGSVTSMPRTHFIWTEFVPYTQDTWRVRPNVTINFGLSWNMNTPPNAVGDDANKPHAFDFKTGKVLYAALGDISPEIYKIDLNNFSPRVGISWQPRFWDGTVIRAGAGIYYTPVNALYNLFGITAPGVSIVQSITNTNPTTPTYMLGQNIFPPSPQVAITRQYADNVSGTLFALDTNLRSSYVEQWSMALQHTFGKNTLAEIDYIGSQSRKLPIRWNADDCSVQGSYVCDPSVRPYKQFPYIYMAANEGSASYNAFVAKFQQQMKDLNFVANYTWSKALTNTVQGGAPVGVNERGTCLSCDKGLAGFNVPQRLVASGVWTLPFGRGKKFLSSIPSSWNQLVGGWSLNTIATFSQGNPFTILAATSTTMDPMTQYRADQVCDGRSSLANKDVRSNGGYWFDPSCFAPPAANHFGNVGVNTITGPGINNWDMGMEKLFSLSEEMNLQFRVEAFNAFNHAQFLNPDSVKTDLNFGKITTARPGRELQFGLKLLW